jgi:phage protein D
VAHTLENTIKAVAQQTALLVSRYGEDTAGALFRLDPIISFKKKRIKATATAASREVTDNSPVFLDRSSRDLLKRRLMGKLASNSPADKRFVVAFGGHSSAAAHGSFNVWFL